MSANNYFHVDVFATRPLTGNGLAVFLDTDDWPASVMQQVTQEMRQFESIFLSDVSSRGATARVFTVEEELPFAGHPVLGAAAVLFSKFHANSPSASMRLELPAGPVEVTTTGLNGGACVAQMNQGLAVAGATLAPGQLASILQRLGLVPADLAEGLPAQVWSTGLPYLVLPVGADALARAAIVGSDLECLLATVGAKFLFVLDSAGRELRTWDNLGKVEDVATGSAAGPAAAYLFAHQLADPQLTLDIAQGRFTGRASNMKVTRDQQGQLMVSGEVWPVARGFLDFPHEKGAACYK